MPQRFLRPGLTTSDAWNSVSFPAQSFFIRLLTLVDDFGRYDGRVLVLHGQCFALRSDITPQETAALRSELHDSGLISVYQAAGKEFIQINKWHERARGKVSRYPDADKPQDSAADRSGKTLPSPSPLHHTPSPSQSWPTDGERQRFAAIMHRKETTAWSRAEVQAMYALGPRSEDEFEVVEAYYAAERSREGNRCRTDLLGLLENWSGEVDRARGWRAKKAPKANGAPKARYVNL
jgi:hypothetical protein